MFDIMFTQEGWLFSVPAIFGTLVFLFRIVLMSIGHHGGMDIDHADVEVGSDLHDSTHAFSLLSVQSITALLMGFGWGGLTARFALGWPLSYSILAGVVVGVIMIYLLGIIMKGIYDLQVSGNITLEDTVGQNGTVYVTVPERGKGMGQVKMVIKERSRIFNAISANDSISTNTEVWVTRANEDNTVTVTKAP